MISHVTVCLLAYEEKGSISNTFCYTKREYSFSVRPIGCTPAFLNMMFSPHSSPFNIFRNNCPNILTFVPRRFII